MGDWKIFEYIQSLVLFLNQAINSCIQEYNYLEGLNEVNRWLTVKRQNMAFERKNWNILTISRKICTHQRKKSQDFSSGLLRVLALMCFGIQTEKKKSWK